MTCNAILDHRMDNGIDYVLTCKREPHTAGPCFPGKWRQATDQELEAMWAVLSKAQSERAERRMSG